MNEKTKRKNIVSKLYIAALLKRYLKGNSPGTSPNISIVKSL